MRIIYEKTASPKGASRRIVTTEDHDNKGVLISNDEVRLWVAKDGYYLAEYLYMGTSEYPVGNRYGWFSRKVSQDVADDLMRMYEDSATAASRRYINS